jgi:hypothetical protein
VGADGQSGVPLESERRFFETGMVAVLARRQRSRTSSDGEEDEEEEEESNILSFDPPNPLAGLSQIKSVLMWRNGKMPDFARPKYGDQIKAARKKAWSWFFSSAEILKKINTEELRRGEWLTVLDKLIARLPALYPLLTWNEAGSSIEDAIKGATAATAAAEEKFGLLPQPPPMPPIQTTLEREVLMEVEQQKQHYKLRRTPQQLKEQKQHYKLLLPPQQQQQQQQQKQQR